MWRCCLKRTALGVAVWVQDESRRRSSTLNTRLPNTSSNLVGGGRAMLHFRGMGGEKGEKGGSGRGGLFDLMQRSADLWPRLGAVPDA